MWTPMTKYEQKFVIWSNENIFSTIWHVRVHIYFQNLGSWCSKEGGITPIKFDVLSSIEIPLVQFFLFFYHFTYLFHLFIYLKLVYSRTLTVLPNFWSSWDVPAFSIPFFFSWKQRYIKENHENNMPIKIYLPSYHWPGDPKN